MTFTEQFANNARSRLAASVSAVAAGTVETWTVDDTSSFPPFPQFRLIVDSELLLCTAVVSATQLTVIRGAEGSAPAGHGVGAEVVHVLTAGSFAAKANDTSAMHLVGNELTGGVKSFEKVAAATSAPPAVTVGAGAGTGATVSLFGSDMAGVISLAVGSSPAANSPLITITFTSSYPSGVAVALTPMSGAAADANLLVPLALASAQSFVVEARNVPTGTLTFTYSVIGGVPLNSAIPGTTEIGNPSIGGSWASAIGNGTVFGSDVTIDTNITLTGFRFYAKGGGTSDQTFLPVVYTIDGTNKPAALVAQAAAATTVTAAQAEGWVSVAMPSTALTAGTTYFLGLLSGATANGAAVQYAATGNAYYFGSGLSSPPDPATSVFTETKTWSFTVTGTTSVTPVATPVDMGYTTLGDTWSVPGNGYLFGNPVLAPETGALSKFKVYAKGNGTSSQDFYGTVFSVDSLNRPVALLGQTAKFTIPAAQVEGWTVVDLPNVGVVKNTYYVLALDSGATAGGASILHKLSTGVNDWAYGPSAGLVPPATWPTPYNAPADLSWNIAATLIVGAAPGSGNTGGGTTGTGTGGSTGGTAVGGGTNAAYVPPSTIALPITDTAAAVQVTTASNLAALITANPNGKFYLANGTYNVGGLTPTSNQVFQGQSRDGVIFDGQGTRANAFGGSATGVKIANLTIRNYVPAHFNGAIDGLNGHGWQVLTCHIHLNNTGVVVGRDGWIVDNCLIAHNGLVGVSTGSANNDPTGQPFLNLNPTVQNCEIAYNGLTLSPDEAGVKVLFTNGAQFLNNHVHHNHESGLWCDAYCTGTLYEGNLVENNDSAGIFHEISYSATVRYNTLKNNTVNWGADQPATGDFQVGAATVAISDSHDVDIYGNLFVTTKNPVGVYNGHSLTNKLYNVTVHGNDATQSATYVNSAGATLTGHSGVEIAGTVTPDPYGGTSIRFYGNQWSPSAQFVWRGQLMNLAQFQAQGQG